MYRSATICCIVQAAAAGRDKEWWAQKTTPSFPSAPIADYSATTTSASTAAAPKQNPFLKGGSQEDTRVRDAPLPGDGKQRQAGDKKDPRKEFEAGLMGAVSVDVACVKWTCIAMSRHGQICCLLLLFGLPSLWSLFVGTCSPRLTTIDMAHLTINCCHQQVSKLLVMSHSTMLPKYITKQQGKARYLACGRA